jgi:DNA-directed RNA polymerase specialized sigma24 family protein
MNSQDGISRHLLERLAAGDSQAASLIYDRYVLQLIALTRQRLSQKLAARVDPEDIVQSAYRSFFARAEQGDYVLERAGDLWRLLAAIATHKLHGQVEKHTAQKRSINREEPVGDVGILSFGTPTAEEVVQTIEWMEKFMRSRGSTERRVLEMRLQGESTNAIATEIGRTERTVRRILEAARTELEERLREFD